MSRNLLVAYNIYVQHKMAFNIFGAGLLVSLYLIYMILTLPNDTNGVVLKPKIKLDGQWAFDALIEELEKEKSDDYVENSDRIKRDSNNNNRHTTSTPEPTERLTKQISTTTPVSTTTAKPQKEGFFQSIGKHAQSAFNKLITWVSSIFNGIK